MERPRGGSSYLGKMIVGHLAIVEGAILVNLATITDVHRITSYCMYVSTVS